MDRIVIEALQVDASIGVHAREKNVRQTLQLDIELGYNMQCAAASDRLCDALDYGLVAETIAGFVSSRHFNLLEHLAEQLAQQLLQTFPVQHIKLHLRKPGAIAYAAAVGVCLERSRQSM
jgi:dihydroneopterin aldolase